MVPALDHAAMVTDTTSRRQLHHRIGAATIVAMAGAIHAGVNNNKAAKAKAAPEKINPNDLRVSNSSSRRHIMAKPITGNAD